MTTREGGGGAASTNQSAAAFLRRVALALPTLGICVAERPATGLTKWGDVLTPYAISEAVVKGPCRWEAGGPLETKRRNSREGDAGG